MQKVQTESRKLQDAELLFKDQRTFMDIHVQKKILAKLSSKDQRTFMDIHMQKQILLKIVENCLKSQNGD